MMLRSTIYCQAFIFILDIRIYQIIELATQVHLKVLLCYSKLKLSLLKYNKPFTRLHVATWLKSKEETIPHMRLGLFTKTKCRCKFNKFSMPIKLFACFTWY
mgnify:CR=1 FL=1